MPGFGLLNAFPMELGGGVGTTEKVYRAMRNAMGTDGTAEDEDNSIDGAWRMARARGIAGFMTADQRAMLQAFILRASDALPYYEAITGLPPDPEASEDERRVAAQAEYTRILRAAIPDLTAALGVIDPRFSIVAQPFDQADVSEPGRAFEDMAGTLPYGALYSATVYPAYSTAFRIHLLFDVGGGVVPGPTEARLISQALRLLHDALPAHNDVVVFLDQGFNLSVDLLDYTAL